MKSSKRHWSAKPPYKRHSIAWKEANTASALPKALIIRNWVSAEVSERTIIRQSTVLSASRWMTTSTNMSASIWVCLSSTDWPHATGYAQPACSAKTIPCSWITPKRASTKRFSRHGTTRRHPKASIRAAVRQHRPAKHPLSWWARSTRTEKQMP